MGDYSTTTLLFAFMLTLGAGLSTGIGSAIAFFTRKTNAKFLSIALGFSAGVMIYLSFVEIFPKAQESLGETMSEPASYTFTTIAFFAGIFITMAIDRLVPDVANPHEARDASDLRDKDIDLSDVAHAKSLMRMGLFTALAIGLHNFPEGLATFMSALGIVAGIFANKFDQMAAITNFVITPLAFLSGTFYSVEALPPVLKTITHYNPVFYLIDGARYGVLGVSDSAPMLGFAVGAGSTLAVCLLAWRMLAAGYRLKA